MAQYFFDKCDCNLDCLDGILVDSGYDFQRIQENVWWYHSQKWSMSITSNYSSEFNLKIDASIKGNSFEVATINNEVIYLAKMFRDACHPNKIVDQGLNELDYNTFEK